MEDKDYLSVVLVVIAIVAVGLFTFSIIKTNPAQDYIPENKESSVPEGTESENINPNKTEPVEESTVSEEPSAELELEGEGESVVVDNKENPTGIKENESNEANMTDVDMIKKAFSEKYDKDVGDVNVVISKNDGEYAQGGVSFAGEMGGGWFLAAMENGDWVIVADGNGTVMCSDIKDYDFPTEMVPECYDETTQTMVERE